MKLVDIVRASPTRSCSCPQDYAVKESIPRRPAPSLRAEGKLDVRSRLFSAEGLEISLWRSLLINLADRFARSVLLLAVTRSRLTLVFGG